MTEIFTKPFTQQEPIPEAGIAAALEVMRHGRLHRYNTLPGETGETAALEEEFAAFTGARYCLAVASGGYALGCALRALGIGAGDRVLTNAFTLAPVPGSIAAIGADPVFVEVTEDLVIDLDDLAAKAATSGARALVLSHMRGHICDMDRLMAICDAAGLRVIEDCAHTMGAAWAGVPSGRHGAVACYSTQTYKHLNSGVGGFLVSDDADLMARAILLSGSYMLYTRHRAAPPPEAFERARWITYYDGTTSATTGREPCPACHAHGRLRCVRCAGVGQLRYEQTFTWSRRGRIYFNEDELSGLERRTVARHAQQVFRSAVDPADPRWYQTAPLRELFAAAVGGGGPDSRPVAAELIIRSVPITEVDYLAGTRSRSLALIGFENELYVG